MNSVPALSKVQKRGSRWEVSTVGFDPIRQAVGSDPDGSGYNLGIRVSPFNPAAPTTRFTYMLAMARFGGARRVRLVGMRQLVTIFASVPNLQSGCNYPLELQVERPSWSFTDGNISWHLRRVPLMSFQTNNPKNAEGLQFLYSRTPALLFQHAPSDVGGYVPPFGGKIPGVPLIAELGTFGDLRFGWRNDHAYSSLDQWFEGPCDIALFASVLPTNPDTRCTLALPTLPAGPTELPSEDAFVLNFPQAVYGRIAGALIFEEDSEPDVKITHQAPLPIPPAIHGKIA